MTRELGSDPDRQKSRGELPTGELLFPISAVSDVENDLSARKLIGNYELIRRIGRGGMGEVYLARHRHWTDRRYAIKLMLPGLLRTDALARFETEIKAIGTVRHPNLVFATDAGLYGDAPYLVMEYIAGRDLQTIVNQFGPLPIADACEIIRQACLGIQHAHDRAIVHRDIKPSNLLLSNTGEVKVVDLGLARMKEESSAKQLTTDGSVLGTADYVSPDQWRDSRRVTTKTDIYALGCSLYCLLTGKPPFGWHDTPSVIDKMNAHLHRAPALVHERRPDVPPQLSDLIASALAKDPDQRIASAAELARSLAPFCVGAVLAKYRVVEPAEIDTKQDTEAVVRETDKSHEPRKPSTRMVASFQIGRIGCVMSIGLLLLLAVSPMWMLRSRPPSSVVGPQITPDPFYVERFWDDPDTHQRVRAGRLGQDTWIVYEGELAKVHFRLAEPHLQNCVLVALVPTTTSNKFEVFGPDQFGTAASGELEFPSSTVTNQNFWRFSDGVGLHGYLLIVAVHKLDREKIQLVMAKAPWPAGPTETGLWEILIDEKAATSGRIVREIYRTPTGTRGTRGVKSFDTGTPGRLAEYLLENLPGHTIRGLLFSVNRLRSIDQRK
jgi:serine/threonine protein kinase